MTNRKNPPGNPLGIPAGNRMGTPAANRMANPAFCILYSAFWGLLAAGCKLKISPLREAWPTYWHSPIREARTRVPKAHDEITKQVAERANLARSEAAKERPRNEDGTLASLPTDCGETGRDRTSERKREGSTKKAEAAGVNRGAVERRPFSCARWQS